MQLRCLVSRTECLSNTGFVQFYYLASSFKRRNWRGNARISWGMLKEGNLEGRSLSHKRSWKTRALRGFLEVLQCPKSWRNCKMHMPWWKRWPKLYSHSRTRSLHAPLGTIGEVFVGPVPKWAFCGLERKGKKLKANSLLPPPLPVGSFPLLRDSSSEEPRTEKLSETWWVA